MGAPGFWDEPETAQKTAQAVTQLKEEVETFRSLETRVEDMEVLCELALEEDDESLLPEMEETLASIRTDVEHRITKRHEPKQYPQLFLLFYRFHLNWC